MQKRYHSKGVQIIEDYIRRHPEQAFDAGTLIRDMHEQGKAADRATIYRTLDRMTRDRRLLAFHPDHTDRLFYQSAMEGESCHKHLHARCRGCGRIIHLENPFAENFLRRVLEAYGFDVMTDSSSLSGYCRDCRAR